MILQASIKLYRFVKPPIGIRINVKHRQNRQLTGASEIGKDVDTAFEQLSRLFEDVNVSYPLLIGKYRGTDREKSRILKGKRRLEGVAVLYKKLTSCFFV